MKKFVLSTLFLALTAILINAMTVAAEPLQAGQNNDSLRTVQMGQTFIVNDASNSADLNESSREFDGVCETPAGTCTFDAALAEANATEEHDVIQFAFTSPTTIARHQQGSINQPVTIDGVTGNPSTCPTASQPANLLITLSNGMYITGSRAHGTTIRGVNIKGEVSGNDYVGAHIHIEGGYAGDNFYNYEHRHNPIPLHDISIVCNHIGIDNNDNLYSTEFDTTFAGIYLGGGVNNAIIGGDTPADRNVISGSFYGIFALSYLPPENYDLSGVLQHDHYDLLSETDVHNRIVGNYIGTTKDGSGNRGNTFSGIYAEYAYCCTHALELDSHHVEIGSLTAPNLIAYNGTGIWFAGGGDGIGTAAVVGNVIHNNVEYGIRTGRPDPDRPKVDIQANRMYDNGELGIDVRPEGLNPHDDDVDSNAPQLLGVAGGQTLGFSLKTSDPGIFTNYRIDVYSTTECHSSGSGEGRAWIESFNVLTTLADGTYAHTLAASLPSGTFITLTATRNGGGTSEFSNCVAESSNFTVNDNGDDSDASPGNGTCATSSGACTLRAAIQEINALTTDDAVTIGFALNSADTTITLESSLPLITNRVIINGSSQPGAGCHPDENGNQAILIKIDGSDLTGGLSGMILAGGSDFSTIQGLQFIDFPGDGLVVSSNSNRIQCNIFGTFSTDGSGNDDDGVHVTGSNNSIGGAASWRRNSMVNNDGAGIALHGSSANNLVSGNYIGVSVDGQSYKNAAQGVIITDNAHSNLIGAQTASETMAGFNVIAGNNGDGVAVSSSGSGNRIAGNFIGVMADGETARGNGGYGINASAPSTTVGGARNGLTDATTVPNVIGDNTLAGVFMSGDDAIVRANEIGATRDGSSTFGNEAQGIYVTGDDARVLDNVVAANELAGIWSIGDRASIADNFVGVPDSESESLIGNLKDGISLGGDDSHLTGNYIGGNTLQGIYISAGDHEVTGNWIGLLPDGATAAGNGRNGINVSGGNNVIGNSNVIAYNGHNGVYLNSNVTFTQITGNVIRHNTRDGIMLHGSAKSNHFFGNTIYGNGQLPIDLNNDGIIRTLNDNLDADTGSNDLMNRVIINSAISSNSSIAFTFHGQANHQHYVEFYRSQDCTGTGSYASLNTLFPFTTDGSGNYSGSITESGFFASQGISAITTNSVTLVGPASSSEFSDCRLATGTPPPTTLQVNDAGDTVDTDGCTGLHCTLREAILAANALSDASTIQFKSGMTINVDHSNPLPAITDEVHIDGTLGSSGASCPVGSGPANLNVMLLGTGGSMGDDFHGLSFTNPGTGGASNSSVRGLKIAGFSGAGVYASAVDNLRVECNEIGAITTGLAPNNWGVRLEGGNTNFIGGTSASDRNVISGNESHGVSLSNRMLGGSVLGNHIGATYANQNCVSNQGNGIDIAGGVRQVTIGGSVSGKNVIVCNEGAGVSVGSPGRATGIDRNTIRYNSIHANGGIGIDLGTDSVTLNDVGDGDSGDNNLLNYPTIDHADRSGRVSGEFDAEDGTYTIDVFENESCHFSGYGQGQTWLASLTITVSSSNMNGDYDQVLTPLSSSASFLTTTATDSDGNTSEFSQCYALSQVPTAVGLGNQAVRDRMQEVVILVATLVVCVLTLAVRSKTDASRRC